MKQDTTISSFLDKLQRTLDKYKMVKAGETVILATSGGLDSMTLLDCLDMLRSGLNIALVVAHLDHGLRGEESRRESLFVQQQALRYSLPFEGGSISPDQYSRGASLQNQARIFRYRFYEHVMNKWQAQKVALAHHRDDNIETILMRILRGTGTTGLKGIPPVREGVYIRPFIDITRKEIEGFARERGILHVEDSSNRKGIYLRNRIRQELLPFLHDRFHVPPSADTLIHMAMISDVEDAYLEEVTRERLHAAIEYVIEGQEIVVRKHMLISLHPAIRRRAIRMAYGRLKGTRHGLSYATIDGLSNGLEKDRPHLHYCLPGGIHVYLEYDRLRFCKEKLWERISFDLPHLIGQKTFITEIGIWIFSRVIYDDVPQYIQPRDSNEVILSLRTPFEEVRIRNFRPGDRFYPLGLPHAKKLKDFFIDEKIPRSLRHRIPIIEIGGKIAWVVGYRIDERYKVNSNISHCIQFCAKKGVLGSDVVCLSSS